MPQDDRLRDADLLERGGNEVCLGLRSPNSVAGPIAVPKARPVKCDHAVCLRGPVEQPAGSEVLDHAPVAMKQDQRHACSPIHVMETNALYRNELPKRRITAFSPLRQPAV